MNANKNLFEVTRTEVIENMEKAEQLAGVLARTVVSRYCGPSVSTFMKVMDLEFINRGLPDMHKTENALYAPMFEDLAFLYGFRDTLVNSVVTQVQHITAQLKERGMKHGHLMPVTL